MDKPANCIIIIFGASGDLTKRKIIPALYNLFCQDLLPESFMLLGVSRTNFSDHSFREHVISYLGINGKRTSHKKQLKKFLERLFYQAINTADVKDYLLVKNRLLGMAHDQKIDKNFIYYLSIAPSMYEPIIHNLGAHNLQKEVNRGWKRIVIEKPFGYNLPSACKLNQCLLKVFKEDQIYRIDHYLGKETVQNVLAFRFANGIFEPLWNRNYIDHIEITSAEFMGIGERGKYYDHTGALRDMVQNHLLQILGMIAMEPPSSFSSGTVRNEALKVFQSLRSFKNEEEVEKYVIRGQYIESIIRGKKILSYRSEKNVDSHSKTETFVALRFYIDNWRWDGVPFYLKTGKRMPTTVTEVVINFKRSPHYLFGKTTDPNQLIIRIQPDEGILLKFGMKLPGTGFQIKNVDMDFHYSDLTDSYISDPYERLLLDCMSGDATLFIRGDAVEACWRFIDPIIHCWETNPKIKIYGYPAGTWGPREANIIFESGKSDWRYPCKNLVSDGLYCEL
jgi:glucose-6-phosphate 1-dehydrogenase